MTDEATIDVDEPTYRYRYTGLGPAIFPDLTGHGVGSLEHDDTVEVPVLIVHQDLEPDDDPTLIATLELVEWTAALEAAGQNPERSDLVDPGLDEVATDPELATGGVITDGSLIGDAGGIEHFVGGPTNTPDEPAPKPSRSSAKTDKEN